MRIPALTMSFALALAVAACGRGNDGAEDMAGATNMENDATADAALGANTLTDNEAAVALPTDANGFATAAVASDLYEIESATLAADKSTSQAVKALAARLKTDHQNSSRQLKAAAQEADVTLTPALDAEKQRMLSELRSASGADFDRLFLQQQRTAHQKALALHQSYAQAGDDEALKTVASKAATIIQGHIAHLNKIGQ
jgi:putative membrane protein